MYRRMVRRILAFTRTGSWKHLHALDTIDALRLDLICLQQFSGVPVSHGVCEERQGRIDQKPFFIKCLCAIKA